MRVLAAGINFSDIDNRWGGHAQNAFYQAHLPTTLGHEGAGIVEETGPDVSGLQVGDRVAWASIPGSYATHILAPAPYLIPLPATISDEQAAALLMQGYER